MWCILQFAAVVKIACFYGQKLHTIKMHRHAINYNDNPDNRNGGHRRSAICRGCEGIRSGLIGPIFPRNY